MKVAAQNLIQNTNIDNGTVSAAPFPQKYPVFLSPPLHSHPPPPISKPCLGLPAPVPGCLTGVWGPRQCFPEVGDPFLSHLFLLSCRKSSDGPIQRFDKCLEEFYALCDQLELCLRLAHECLSQSCDSAKHSPTLVPTATKPDAVQPDSLPYPQYLAVIKAQIACAKDIHTALLDCANKVTGKTPAPPTGPGGTL
uniref:Mediator of RNA polymerase II transcription subunit 29 n=1 Tax=Oryctolagus cuniculus TaxID=9986 RepID=G1SJM0_RABIT